jgi:hypothetical protein
VVANHNPEPHTYITGLVKGDIGEYDYIAIDREDETSVGMAVK